ncbi:MAG: hypothetical protein JO097_13320 [Acidobacteriaceae bacterium]|nr:hypothetical protein [Acidobacteriaceae bacterium]MBV9765689.1 hypothetical protein [Acidobacteriaceae bacterium]
MDSGVIVRARVTRREWIALSTAVPLVAQVTQKVPPQGAPAPAPPAATPEQKLQKAYADVHEVSDRLSKIEVPMNVEPAFAFRP